MIKSFTILWFDYKTCYRLINVVSQTVLCCSYFCWPSNKRLLLPYINHYLNCFRNINSRYLLVLSLLSFHLRTGSLNVKYNEWTYFISTLAGLVLLCFFCEWTSQKKIFLHTKKWSNMSNFTIPNKIFVLLLEVTIINYIQQIVRVNRKDKDNGTDMK